jgi:UDP-glucose 4-epimerase
MIGTILCIGGAGYVGSHAAYLAAQQGYRVIILDALLHGQHFKFPWATCIKGDYGDEALLKDIFKKEKIDAVMHFASYIEVGESVKEPAKFYSNNVVKTLTLLNVMQQYFVTNLIFSSSCAVYGPPQEVPIPETHQRLPVSPYGKTKNVIEYILEDYAHAYGLTYVALRYFNASGATPERSLGEEHDPETHLIPLLLRAMTSQKPFYIFGADYPTPDGTAIRDYVHVLDIADAHLRALKHLLINKVSDVFNLGTGVGFSVAEIVAAAETIFETKINTIMTPARPGDVAKLVANPDKAYQILCWQPRYSSLEFILKSAYKWEQQRPRIEAKGLKAITL